jgi:hypothetical protein
MAGDKDEPNTEPPGGDDVAEPRVAEPAEAAAAGAQPPSWRRRWKRWMFGTAAFIVLFPILALVIWTWGTLTFSYSQGERTGYIQKFSQKGWLCKTWEGELAQASIPGTLTEKFHFTVRDDSVAAVIDSLNRTWDGRVALHYEQHRGVPFRCFGETQYFVDRVSPVKPAIGRPTPTPPPSTTPPAGTPTPP